MSRILLDVDPLSGVRSYVHHDTLTNETTLETVGDATAGLEWAKYLKNTEGERKTDKEFQHYCHIPASVLVQWHGMGIDTNNPDELVRMVNRPEWSYLKVTSKRA